MLEEEKRGVRKQSQNSFVFRLTDHLVFSPFGRDKPVEETGDKIDRQEISCYVRLIKSQLT